MRAMIAYAGLSERAASEALADGVVGQTDRTLRSRFSDLAFTDDEAQLLADALAKLCAQDGRGGIPAAFLWPAPFPPIVQASVEADEAVRQQLAEAVSAIKAAQGLLPRAIDA